MALLMACSSVDQNFGAVMEMPPSGIPPGPKRPLKGMQPPGMGMPPGMQKMSPGAQMMPPGGMQAPSAEIVAGYENQYGTKVGGSFNPATGNVGGEVRFPVGGHQSGWNVSAEGGWNPGQGANAMLRFGRTNVPQVSPGQLERAVQEQGGLAAQMLRERDPEGYASYLEQLRRQEVDRAMGVGVPGRPASSVYLGVRPGGAGGTSSPGQSVPNGRFAGDRREEVGPLLLRGGVDLMEAGGRR